MGVATLIGMSRRRLVLGGVVLAVVGAALVAVLLGGEDQTVELAVGDADTLEAAACPPAYDVLRAGRFTAAEIEAAKGGNFAINGEGVELEPAVDWTINPEGSRAFVHTLYKFQWIAPLLYAYRGQGDLEALEQARDLVLDFADANPPDGDPVDPDVWDDKRTGDRGPYLAYVMRAAECEGLLEPEQREPWW